MRGCTPYSYFATTLAEAIFLPRKRHLQDEQVSQTNVSV